MTPQKEQHDSVGKRKVMGIKCDTTGATGLSGEKKGDGNQM